MPTRNVNLTDELDRFVLGKVESGRYENASEVVRAALRTLEREEREYEAKLAGLRAAIDAGDASGIAGSLLIILRQAVPATTFVPVFIAGSKASMLFSSGVNPGGFSFPVFCMNACCQEGMLSLTKIALANRQRL